MTLLVIIENIFFTTMALAVMTALAWLSGLSWKLILPIIIIALAVSAFGYGYLEGFNHALPDILSR